VLGQVGHAAQKKGHLPVRHYPTAPQQPLSSSCTPSSPKPQYGKPVFSLSHFFSINNGFNRLRPRPPRPLPRRLAPCSSNKTLHNRFSPACVRTSRRTSGVFDHLPVCMCYQPCTLRERPLNACIGHAARRRCPPAPTLTAPGHLRTRPQMPTAKSAPPPFAVAACLAWQGRGPPW